ncbi:MAG: peptidase dimerization domain-containing protein, partial [Pseudomonadota bacterium]
SGGAHEQGVSANLALAQQIVAIEALTDYERGVTVNVGMMGGGEKRNTIPGCADAYVDLRYPAIADGQYLLAEVEAIAAASYAYNPQFPDLPKTEFWGVLHRPAKEENAVVDALIADAMGLSALIGEPIQGAMFSGGGTDGSIAQSVGLPTVDSLGLNGSGAHSSREHTTVDSLIARTKLAAVMIGREIQAQSAR